MQLEQHAWLSSLRGKKSFELENMKGLKYVGLFLSVAVMLGTPENMAFEVDSY